MLYIVHQIDKKPTQPGIQKVVSSSAAQPLLVENILNDWDVEQAESDKEEENPVKLLVANSFAYLLIYAGQILFLLSFTRRTYNACATRELFVRFGFFYLARQDNLPYRPTASYLSHPGAPKPILFQLSSQPNNQASKQACSMSCLDSYLTRMYELKEYVNRAFDTAGEVQRIYCFFPN